MNKWNRIPVAGLGLLILTGCVSFSAGGLEKLGNVTLVPTETLAAPPVLGVFEDDEPVNTVEDWQTYRAPALREAFQRELYGFQPDSVEIINTVTERVTEDAYGGIAVLDAVTLTVRFSFGDGPDIERDIRLAVAKPKAAAGPVSVILKMDTCPFNESFQDDSLPDGNSKFHLPISALQPNQLPDPLPEELIGKDTIEATANATCKEQGSGFVSGLVQYSLGRYHDTPPVKEAVEQGYAFASINVRDFVLDNRRIGSAQLELLSKGAEPGTAWGSLAAWAFQYSRAVDYLDTDPALDPTRTAIYGHSRFGKAALIAGALDERIDAVIAHQSGRGGAALFGSSTGEPIADMVDTYPQWLSQDYAAQLNEGHTLPFDQHHLLALLAPRPVLLGHGRRDGWSDPDGVFRAAKGASPAYQLFGKKGLTAARLSDFDPSANIAYWMRPGTHGEVKEDWEAFFEFLGAHFQP